MTTDIAIAMLCFLYAAYSVYRFVRPGASWGRRALEGILFILSCYAGFLFLTHPAFHR